MASLPEHVSSSRVPETTMSRAEDFPDSEEPDASGPQDPKTAVSDSRASLATGCGIPCLGTHGPDPRTSELGTTTQDRSPSTLKAEGIERLKRKNQPREVRGSCKLVKEAFGGEVSLHWLNPFSGPCQPQTPLRKDLVRQLSSLSDLEHAVPAQCPSSPSSSPPSSSEGKERDLAEMTDE